MRYVRIPHTVDQAPSTSGKGVSAAILDVIFGQQTELEELRSRVYEWWIEIDDKNKDNPVQRELGISENGDALIGFPLSRVIIPKYGGEFGGSEGIGEQNYPEVLPERFEAAWRTLASSLGDTS